MSNTPETAPKYIPGWPELAQLPESETHRIEMDPSGGCGWIKEKANPDDFGHYLSTHTFYGLNHRESTRVLRRCGWNVTCANWDGPKANKNSKPPMSTPETDIQPRLVQHLFEGGALRRFSADGPNDARDNFHDLRWNGYRFDVRGAGSAFLTGDGCLLAAMYHPEKWEILPNNVIPKHP